LTIRSAGDVVPRVLEFGPIGLEGFDGLLVEFMLRKNLAVERCEAAAAGRRDFCWWRWARGLRRKRRARPRRWRLRRRKAGRRRPTARIYNHEDAESVWKVRESALGATVCVPGEPDRWEGWDDAGIPPAHLGTYLRKLTALMAEYGYRSPLYGHYGQGCVHLRINFDFRTVEGLRKFREFIERAADLVVSLGGSLSGEHGDGQARAVLLPKMFGPELMAGVPGVQGDLGSGQPMNPGKLVDAVRVYDPVENLRYGPRDGEANSKLETHFVFAADQGSFGSATARCVGVGACLKKEGGVMCPSYRATGEEQHSTRGRARLLWEMLAGALRKEGFQSEAVHEALDLVPELQGLQDGVPGAGGHGAVQVRVSGAEVQGQAASAASLCFGFADKMARLGSLTPALTNFHAE
jgi:hypothetical protein